MAVVVYSLVVNQGTAIDDLTADQVHDIYSGVVTNWSQVGGADVPVRVVTRGPESDVPDRIGADYDVAARGATSDDCWSPTARNTTPVLCVRESTAEVLDVVEYVQGAIGYAASPDLSAYPRVRRLAVDGKPPDFRLAESGKYPFWTVLSVHTRGTPTADTRSFLSFLRSTAATEIVERAGFLPACRTHPARASATADDQGAGHRCRPLPRRRRARNHLRPHRHDAPLLAPHRWIGGGSDLSTY